MKTTTPRPVLLAFVAAVFLFLSPLRAQMIIDSWGFTTGVDTTLWMDLGEDYTVLFSTNNGYQYHNYASSGLRDIGFPFTLGATTHTKFSTNVNGTVRLGTAPLSTVGYINEPLGQNINAGPRIDALGRAGLIDTSCYMRSAVLGDSGSRILVVEARLREYADRGSAEGHYVHFQVQLFEAGGLRIVYGQVDSGAIYGSSQNGVAATGNSSNKDVIFFDFAAQRAVRFNGNCTLRNAVEDYPTRGRWYMLAPNPAACPRATASTVWVTNYSAAGVELTQSTADARNYRLRVAGTDIDTLWNAGQATFTLPPLNPRTDYTLSLHTLCGEDTSYYPFNITITTGCGAVVRLPWSTAFPSLSHSDCWSMPYVSGNNADFTRRWRQTSTSAYVYCPEAAGTYNSWLISPVVYLPDGDGLTLQWDYRALLSSAGVAPHVELRVAPCAEDGTAADGAWTALMVLDGEYQSYTTLAANLDAWRGQRVRVAWVRTGEGGGIAYVDNVSLYRQQEPQLLREVPAVALVGDTTHYTARMFAGADSNVLFTWHSSLLDSTIVTTDSMVSVVSVVYPNAGIDTVTVVLSNAYGSDMATAVVEVVDCRTVMALPWSDDFAGSNACWTIDGWRRASSTLSYNENGDYTSHDNVMYPNNTGKYMLSQPVAIPATGVEHLSLWAEAGGPLMVRVSPTASTDTASYTDTLLTVPNSSRIEIYWRTAGLAAYAGQTVRFGFFKTAGTQAFVSRVKVDYDTLPALGNMVVPAISRTDSTIACSVELLRGVGEGLTYTWHSSLMDTTWVGTGANGSYGFNVTYTIGGTDTITVVAANAYGTDTMVRTVQVMDCRPVTALPWREDFDDDLLCWYHTYNSTNNRWQRSYRYSAPYYIDDYYALSSCSFSESLTTPVDAWLVSRAITIPADTTLAVRLFWQVGITSGDNLTNNYRVMVSTAADCTDTTAYEELYHDTLPLPNQNNMVQRSVSLTPYAGQTIFIAFRNQPLVRRSTALMIDTVEVRETSKPRLLLAADNETFYHGDTATFTATLTEGSDSNLVYTWHSSLLDSTWVDTAAGGQWRLTYGLTGGMDTVTLVASNAYGSDTATVCVHSVIDSLPSINRIAHGSAFVGDTTVYTVVDNRSVVTGLTYTWHSTLLDTTVVLQSSQAAFRLVYTAEGNDTVTVVKSNVFGSSTSSVVVAVGSHPLPEVALTIPARVAVGVAAEFAASINDCSANGRTFTWHSTLMDTTVATLLPTLALMYEAEGTDTLTVIASNAYGADTAVAVLEVVDCSAHAVPYTEDFEGVAPTASGTQGELPACWNLGWNGSNAAYGPHVITTGGYQYISNIPDNALFMVAGSSTGYGNTAEVSLPRMADSLQALSLAFDYRFDNSSHGTLTVGYYDGDTFTALQTMTPQSQTYRRDTVSFASAIVPDGRIALRWTQASLWYAVAIDNVDVFHTPASFFVPQITIAAPASVLLTDSATYSVTLNDRCSPEGLSFTWHSTLLDSTIVTTESILTLGYTAEGVDTVTVIASNAYGADTAVAYIYAVDCNNITLPYVETFEGVSPIPWNTTGQSSLPLCWQMAYNGTNASIHQPTVVSSYQYINSLPDNALLMMAGNSNNGYATWVQAELPAFGAPLSSLAIALDYRYESANAGTLTVGYVDDTLGYIPVDTLAPHAGSYTRDSIYFADAAIAGNARIALRYAYNSFFYAAVIDNIEVFINNGILAPDMLTVENVTATCATLRWSEVDTATAYRVALSGAMSIDTVVTDTTLTLCGLADDADYSVTVVPLVGSDAGRRISTTFHTLMLCAPLAQVNISPEGIISWQYDTSVAEQSPAGVEIEVIDQQGQVLVLTDTAYFSPYVPAGLTPGHTYSFAVRTLCASATANTADTVVMQVAPSVCAEAASNTIPSNSHFMDNFWEDNYSQVVYPASFAAGIDTLYGIALRVAQYDPYPWQTTSGTCRYDIYVGQTNGTLTSPLTSDSLTMVVQNKHYSLSGTGWHNFVFDTPYIYDGTGNLVVTIVSRQSNTTYDPVYGVHTDATCTHFVQDADHVSSNINPSTFNFQWETNANIPDIRLLGGCGGSTNTCLAPETEVVAVDTHSVSLQWAQRGSESLWQVEYRPVSASAWQVAGTTSATSFTITGLAQATHYLVRAGAVCSDSLVVYGFPDSVTTLCGYMELPYTISFLADEYPCWTLGSNLYHNNWNGVTLSEWNTNRFLISPEVNANIADLRATITSLRPVAESYESRFAVGVGNADGSNVIWIDTIGFLQQNTVQTNEVHFNHYTGSGRHIILRGVEGTSYIRQFTLEAFAGCVPVHDVTVDNIGEHSAQLTWVPEVATHTWAVYLDGALVATTSTPSYTLTGLNSNTQYTVAVREICGAGDTSTVVTRLFQTRCDAFALPYFEEFDQAPAIGNDHILTDCWIFHKDGRYASAYCIGDQWSYTCLMFDDDAYSDTHAVNYVCSPRLQVGYGGATVRFKGQTTFDGIFTVGIMPDPYDTTTFIPVRDITVSSGGMAWYSFSTDTIAGAPVGSTLSVAFRFVGDNGHGVIDSLFVEDIPVTTYDLAIGVNDTTMGSVSGAGSYEEGSIVTITATANDGYHFVTWNDGVTVSSRTVKVDFDTSFTAYFAPDTTPVAGWHTVSVVAVMADGSPVTWLDEPVSGAGTYADGDTVVLQGQVNGCGTSLVYWLTAEGDTVYDNPYTFVIHSDVSLTAVFREDGGIDSDLQPPTSDITLHPNPATSSVTLSGLQPGMLLTLLDLNGRQLQEFRIQDSELKIDVSSLPAGTYFLRLSSPSATVVRRLVKR